MPRFRYTTPPVVFVASQPFLDAEEAWLWSHLCMAERDAGGVIQARLDGLGRVCAPVDVMLVARRLARVGRLAQDQLRVLMRFGARLLPPDPRIAAEAPAVPVWRAGLARLEPPLRAKGIVV